MTIRFPMECTMIEPDLMPVSFAKLLAEGSPSASYCLSTRHTLT